MVTRTKDPIRSTAFVADTHTLWWYLRSPELLSPDSSYIFSLAERGRVVIFVPAIVIAELYFLSVKLGEAVQPAELMDLLDSMPGVEMLQLGRLQLEQLNMFPEIRDIHDRLIAAEAASLNVPLVTKDAELLALPQIETIW